MEAIKRAKLAYGWVDPATKEVRPVKILVPICYVDTELTQEDFVKPETKEVKADVLSRYGVFSWEIVEGKIRFWVYSDVEFDKLRERLGRDKIGYVVHTITLAPEQKSAIVKYETEEEKTLVRLSPLFKLGKELGI